MNIPPAVTHDGHLGFVPMLGHAFGKRYDLPVPLWLFVFGGAAVVFLSFLLVLPRAVAPATAGEAKLADRFPLQRPTPVRWMVAGLVVVGLMVCGWIGSQSVAENILPSFFWLAVWVATPISCGVIGDWTRPVNPFSCAGTRLRPAPPPRRAARRRRVRGLA